MIDLELNNAIDKEKLEHYLGLTRKAREKATPIPEGGSSEYKNLQILLRMADDYALSLIHI